MFSRNIVIINYHRVGLGDYLCLDIKMWLQTSRIKKLHRDIKTLRGEKLLSSYFYLKKVVHMDFVCIFAYGLCAFISVTVQTIKTINF